MNVIAVWANPDAICGIWIDDNKDGKTEFYKISQGKYEAKLVWLADSLDNKGNPLRDRKNPDKSKRNDLLIGQKVMEMDWDEKEKCYILHYAYDPKWGMSGTGKTSLPKIFAEALMSKCEIVEVESSWRDKNELLGYYNEFTKRFNETLLLEKMYEANYSKDMYVAILDEMNIARVEYYFAEFLSLLELPDPEERYLDVVSDKWESDPIQLKEGRIKLPVNMWFIGTANNDDSTFSISDKVYDRAMILDLEKKSERFAAPATPRMRISAEQFEKMVEGAIREYTVSNRNRKRLAELDAYLIEHYHITFGNRIMKQILSYVPVYIACGGEELDALDDILAKKVMRKLESQNPIYFRNTADELLSYLDELFGEAQMKLCRDYINRIRRNA